MFLPRCHKNIGLAVKDALRTHEGGGFLKSFRMLSQVMGSFNCGIGWGALAINSLLTHNIPAIKLGDSKSLPESDMEFFLTCSTLLSGTGTDPSFL